jgi:hypothetical protein
MVREFQAVLDGLPGKSPEPLEEYRELIGEMRRRGLTYREIAGVLADRFQVQADLGAVYDVLRAGARSSRPLPARRQVKAEAAPAPSQAPQPPKTRPAPQLRQAVQLRQVPRMREAPQPAHQAARTMSAALPQVRKVVEKPVFEYDENEPLRLTGDSRSIE